MWLLSSRSHSQLGRFADNVPLFLLAMCPVGAIPWMCFTTVVCDWVVCLIILVNDSQSIVFITFGAHLKRLQRYAWMSGFAAATLILVLYLLVSEALPISSLTVLDRRAVLKNPPAFHNL